MNSGVTARILVGVLLVLPTVVAGASSRPDLKSNRVELNSSELAGKVGGKPQLILELRNKTADAAWVQVRVVAPPPNAECALAKAIKPGESVSYVCDQEKTVPDVDYPIFVTVFRDEGLTDQLETAQTAMRFPARDVNAFEESLALPTLPATFEYVISSEKFGFSTALFGGYGASGTLVVQESGLDYSTKKQVTGIPISQIRSVTIKQLGLDESTMWVVVEYMEGDAARTLGFQGHPHRGGGFRIHEMHKTISYVLSKNRSS
jgi:phenylpyruvate tautomerase PptA (4-oxalocrotonate tautomerase family)